ncbi:MAG TPA: glycoside hydrolase family 3 N-terminal domain-containing protein, partial [Terriglobales bacterium]|nr:glycoside hydrolase family 3 N-terminal domain-containing protein [Terriglobales bacterium]
MSKNLQRCSFVIIVTILVSSFASAQSWANDPKIESRVNALLKRMTLEEKLGQINQYSAGSPTGPGTGRSNYEEMIAKGQVGSLFNVNGPQVNEFQKVAVEKSRLHIPLIFGLDVIHGYRTEFPTPLAMSATWDPALIEKAARVAAVEASADGVRWTFSPMVDIAHDARWGRIVEGAGEDPYLGSAIARAYVRGYQGKSLSDPTSIAACAKHFVGYGAAEAGRDYNSTEISDRTLRQIYLPPFEAAKQEGVATFMSAFNAINGVPASANPFTLGILKNEWKFKGFVVSDWTSILELIAHGIGDGPTVARKAVTAGVDMDMEGNLYWTTLADQVKSGKVPMAVIDDAVRRILRVKIAMGLFEHPYADLASASKVTLTPENVALAREVAEKSFVLLKNDGVLPLKPEAKIAVIGPLADDAPNTLGAWSAKGDPKDVVTLWKAFSERSASRATYAKGTEILTHSETGFDEALKAAQQADVVVMAMGEAAGDMTGEAASRSELGLPGNQEKLLEAVTAVGKPVVLLVYSGRPLVLNWASTHVAAIIEAWHPGIQAGPALVNTLFGTNNPSGKLTVSFPRSVGQEPLHYDQLSTGRPLGNVDDSHPPASAEEKYKSRYIDQRIT